MAREKGTGSLQREKSGRWTVRIGVNGKRFCRSARTKDRGKAEAFLERMLAPLGLGAYRLPLAEAWQHYEMSPNRGDLAKATLDGKRVVWMAFARWVEKFHPEITHLAELTSVAVGEYLLQFRANHSAGTYNSHVCILREICHVLSEKAGMVDDPWAGVCLRADDAVSRRELTAEELGRLVEAAGKAGAEWRLLVTTGIYTGLRLGDCCRLKWEDVNMGRSVIQLIPQKTRKYAHRQPITIPIHPQLQTELQGAASNPTSSSFKEYVNPVVADLYLNCNWRLDDGLRRIFKAANITMSKKMEGRHRKSVVASFHSLRHTFVSFAANAGVPLPVVQSIVGHTSTAMTRHYYHENEEVLRQAVAAIPSLDDLKGSKSGSKPSNSILQPPRSAQTVEQRLRQLEKLKRKSLISEEEYASTRSRILAEI